MRRQELWAFLTIIGSGLALGAFGVLLTWWGNPAGGGICVSCFLENTAGALGLHANERMMYLRPEIIGFVLGAFLSAYFGKEFVSRGNGGSLVHFLVGLILIVGSAVFIGCPLKMMLRLSAGDLNALVGLGGLVFGIYIGVIFLREGYFLGVSRPSPMINSIIFVSGVLLLLFFLLTRPAFIRFSIKGAGAEAAPIAVALLAGVLIGALAQRSRFCVTGAWRNLLLAGDLTLMWGLLTLFIVALVLNLRLGYFSLDRLASPSSHPDTLWNFLSMTLVGWGSVLVGGCPFRQLILAGEGDNNAISCVLGMLFGAALVQNFAIRSLVSGPTLTGKLAVVFGFMIFVGLGRFLLGEEGENG